jgi:hypothetical protein
MLISGLLFHLGILATMEIGWFSQVSMCWYVLFVPGEQISACLGWLVCRRRSAEVKEPGLRMAG